MAEQQGFPSLSEQYDYEPNLEFDDTWLHSPINPLPLDLDVGEDDVIVQSASDGTIEENYEKELALPSYPEWLLGFGPLQSENDNATQIGAGEAEYFSKLVDSAFIEIAGEDQLGRLIVVISACRLPSAKEVPSDILLKYLQFTLDKFVEQDYIIVYFHFGLKSESKPPISWFWHAYRTLDRKFKKNLKSLYLVHPTNMIRILWRMFRPVISVKFGKKVNSVNYLHELQLSTKMGQLPIPECVREHDQRLLALNAGPSSSHPSPALQTEGAQKPTSIPTQQFGVSLEFIREHNPEIQDCVPPIVRYCVDFLSKPESLATEGIFRRTASHTALARMIKECNSGAEVNFDNDPHCAAVLLKAFFRELEDPLLTHRLFDEIIQFSTWPMPQRPRMTKILLLEKLPLENYTLLKYIIKFLWQVAGMSSLNKMTVSNLAVVFGPNFLWPPEGRLSLNCVIPINQFTEFILENHEEIFII